MSGEDKTIVSLELVAGLLVDAVPAQLEAEPAVQPGSDPPARKRRPRLPGDVGAPAGPIGAAASSLPPGCPIVPLGIEGDVCHYLDAEGQHRGLRARDHGRLNLLNLFGRRPHLATAAWPRLNRQGDVVGWHPEDCAQALMKAAAEAGIWTALDHLRGPGAWLGPEQELVLHCGDQIWRGRPHGEGGMAAGTWLAPGAIAPHVYPAKGRIAIPAADPQPDGDNGAGGQLLQLLNTWAWKRGRLDAHLLLGMVAAGILGGALKWRPVMWITGGKGTGKSSLHDVLKLVWDDALISVSDASAAGLWQKLKQSTLPVAFDELEAEEDNRRADAVIKLARQAASGGVVLRGGADHQASEFVARSCFLFSSILLPPLLSQDRSRIAILELGALQGHHALRLDAAKLRTIGARIRRRLVDGWARLAPTLETYAQALAERGHSKRGCDVFGTLLACADLVMFDQVNGDYAAEMAEQLPAADDDTDDADEWLHHLLSSVTDVHRDGARFTLAEWITKAAGLDPDARPEEARRILGTVGLAVEFDAAGTGWLLVANRGARLAELFRGTHWAGRSGATAVWVQTARSVQGAKPSAKPVWIGGATVRATQIPLAKVIRPAPTPGDEGKQALAAEAQDR